MKRMTIATVLVLSLLLTMVGCSKESSSTGSHEAVSTISATEAGTFPVTNEKVTLEVLMKSNPTVENFETNEFTKWYEEQTNVHIKWTMAPANNTQEKINLVLAGGDYPDIFMDCGIPITQQVLYAQQGVFQPLNSIIEENSKYYSKFLDEYPLIKDEITLPDGEIYHVTDVSGCYHCMYGRKMWMNKEWLETLGLDKPTTTDEFYQTLKAFKEKDPNGNGLQDELPLAAVGTTGTTSIDSFLMNAFTYDDGEKRIIVNNGNVEVTYMSDAWKEGLKYLNMMYSEGLIAPETFTMDGSQLKQIGENPDVMILGAAPALWWGQLTQHNGESGRWMDYFMIPPLKGPEGVQLAAYFPDRADDGAIISTTCEYPEIAFRWLDMMFDQEVTFRSQYGNEGVEWRYATDDEFGSFGDPALFVRLPAFSVDGAQNISWRQSGLSMRDFKFTGSMFVEANENGTLEYGSQNWYAPYALEDAKVLPPLLFSEEQSAEIADLETSVLNYVNESIARFIIGDLNIEKDWDSYLRRFDDMKIDRYIEIYQNAFDSKYK